MGYEIIERVCFVVQYYGDEMLCKTREEAEKYIQHMKLDEEYDALVREGEIMFRDFEDFVKFSWTCREFLIASMKYAEEQYNENQA